MKAHDIDVDMVARVFDLLLGGDSEITTDEKTWRLIAEYFCAPRGTVNQRTQMLKLCGIPIMYDKSRLRDAPGTCSCGDALVGHEHINDQCDTCLGKSVSKGRAPQRDGDPVALMKYDILVNQLLSGRPTQRQRYKEAALAGLLASGEKDWDVYLTTDGQALLGMMVHLSVETMIAEDEEHERE